MSNQNDQYTPADPFIIGMNKLPEEEALTEYIGRYDELPPEIKVLLSDNKMSDFINDNLGVQFQISSEQKVEFAKILQELLFVEISIRDFSNNVRDRLRVSADIADSIVKYTADNLLSHQIKTTLNQLNQGTWQSSPAPAQQNQPETGIIESAPAEPNTLDLRNQ